MTYEEIIKIFHTIVDDMSELSGSEEIKLATRVERRIANKRGWLDLVTTHEGTISGGFLALPDDFKDFDKEYEHDVERAIYQGNNRYPIMPNQRRYRESYVTLDKSGNQLRIPSSITGTAEFDYIHTIPERTTEDSPFMNSDFHEMIAYGMALEFDIIEQSESAFSKQAENRELYQEYMDDMEANDNDLREVGEVY